MREVKRTRGGGDWRRRGERDFDAMRVVVSVGRSGGNTCGEVLRFVEEDVLDKEQYSQRYSDKLKVYAGERERNREREREGGEEGGRGRGERERYHTTLHF